MNRDKNISVVRETQGPWDVVVIGGGATGAGCAVDAASRGLSVLLLDGHDFGKGTSSRSTKLIHGGVRYLRQGNVSLVREALRERGILLSNAPHVVHPQPFVIPCYGLGQKAFYGLGMKVYDRLAGVQNIGGSRLLSRAETAGLLPTVKTKGLSGGVQYFDGRFDDSRLLIDLVSASETLGAVALNYAKVSAIGHPDGRRVVSFEDGETGEKMQAQARVIINSAGIFSDEVRRMSDGGSAGELTFAQGIHVVLGRRFLPSDAAVMIPKTSDGRVLFCIPWHGQVLVGTTDTPVGQAQLEPEAKEAEVDFVLETAGQYLAERPGRGDVLSVFAGIRPLASNGQLVTSKMSREFTIAVDANGLVTVTGGKWTTYRRMAEKAVDKAIEVGSLPRAACRTEKLAIPPPETSEPGDPLHPQLDVTEQEIVRAVRAEMARTVEDVLARRTRCLFLNAAASVEIAPRAAAIMAAELGENEVWAARQVEQFNRLAARYMLS